MLVTDKLINNAIEGEMPKVSFKFPSCFTEKITLTLYKWMLLIDSYTKYKSLSKQSEFTQPEEIKEIVEDQKQIMLERK